MRGTNCLVFGFHIEITNLFEIHDSHLSAAVTGHLYSVFAKARGINSSRSVMSLKVSK